MTEHETRERLDEALRAHMAGDLADDGEVIVSWIAIAATRRHDGGGVILYAGSDEALPRWEVRGMVEEMRGLLDAPLDNDE